MRRLFWKFFAIAGVIQVAITISVGTTIWLRARERLFETTGTAQPFPPGPPPDARPEPPPGTAGPPPRPGMRPFRPGPPLLPIEPLIGGVLASLLCAALMARYVARPIELLRASFEAVAAGDLDVRIAHAMGARRDELADLGRAFDATVARLRSLLRGQKRLLHDVSHEMRSPLARIQAAIGLARQKPENVLPSIDRIERDTARMDRLIGELLTLARIDAHPASYADEEVDLAELVGGILDDASYEARAGGCALEVRGTPAGASMRGNAELLLRAIENIVRNAVRYAGAGGVLVEFKTLPGAAPDERRLELSISDSGPGVADEELAAIFQPFYRGEAQRSPDGFGLGLALAKRIVEAHRGRIAARNLPLGGLCVELSLPLEPIAAAVAR
jgi:two-component system, OmpR family, sensor kinase